MGLFKKIAGSVLFFLIFSVGVSFAGGLNGQGGGAGAPAAPVFQRGDVNQDGRIDISDPVNLLSFLFSGGDEPQCKDAADTNDDGHVDLSDPIYLLSFLFTGGNEPPSPFRDLGPDPTPDDVPSCP